MQCPVCRIELKIAERNGVEIDYCPQCRGIWLDRGELDKIIERAASFMHPDSRRDPAYLPERPRFEEHRDEQGHYNRKKHRRKSFLGDFFDFD
jgi:uncharacterized protein